MAKSGQQHTKADVGGQRPAKDYAKSKDGDKSTTGKDAKPSGKTSSGKKS